MRNYRAALYAVLVLLSVLPLQAAREGLSEKGFVAGRTFAYGDLDSVNTFNGNLIVTVPIGPTFTVGDAYTYSFKVTYNSSIWDHEDIAAVNEGMGGFSGGGMYITYKPESIPDRDSNAGLGWHFSLGSLKVTNTKVGQIARWAYVSSDGAEHVFFKNLHGNEGDYTSDPSTGYSRDSTYLRMKRITTNERTVEFPDGRVEVFRCLENCNSRMSKWRLEESRDRLGNGIYITYSSDTLNPEIWKICELGKDSEPNVRCHTVRWMDSSMVWRNPNTPKRLRLQSIKLDSGATYDVYLPAGRAESIATRSIVSLPIRTRSFRTIRAGRTRMA